MFTHDIMKKLNKTFITPMKPIHGFAAETSTATVKEFASRIVLLLSTTYVISSTIMGVGASKMLSAVRCGIGWSIVLAWMFMCAILSWITIYLVSLYD